MSSPDIQSHEPENNTFEPSMMLSQQDIGKMRKESTVTRKVHLATHPDTQRLTQEGVKALKNYIAMLNRQRPILNEQDRAYLEGFIADLMAERNVRADDAESPEIKEAAEIMDGLFHYAPFAMLCMDGRVNLTHEFGFSAKMKGSSIQTPAGNPIEFIPDANGELFLDPESNTATQLGYVMEKHDAINEILDSHLACAAREKHEKELGNQVPDHGLREDVIHKFKISRALQKYVEERFEEKTVNPIQVSFDPHHGYLYMGLETKAALDATKKKGFTEDMLEQLSDEGKIVSTERLTKNPAIRDMFESAYRAFEPRPDWKTYYKETALQFWKAIETMRERILPIIQEKLVAGPYASGTNKKALDDRAMLLLSNAFAAFCNNKDKKYEFGEHKEDFVSVTERDYRPCHHMGFSVYSLDLDTLPAMTVFASQIVRGVREKGTTKSDCYPTKEEFVAAPVPVIVKEIYRYDLDDSEWEKLRGIDWSFLEGVNWKEISDSEFVRLIEDNNKDGNNKSMDLTAKMGIALNNLRQRMRVLYNRRSPTAELLMKGKLFAVPVLADRSRRFQVIVPLYRKGFEPK